MRTSLLLLIALSACVDPSAGRDRDGDGFFTAELDGDDCDDSNAAINPGASEACGNGVDDDCDGVVDDAGVGERSWFVDSDQDGFAGPTEFTGCTAPAGAFADLSLGTDCDDIRSDINPGAEEVWYDGVDQDCAGDDDNDADGDGFVAMSQGGEDCADDDGAVNPDAEEVCNNGVDDNCDELPNQCEYAGEVDLAAMASTVFSTESSKQWLDDFNGDGVMDALLQVDGGGESRNRLELFFGPLQAMELEADAVIWGPDGQTWSQNDNRVLATGDLTGNGMTDIVVSGPYPDQQGSTLTVFTTPLVTGDYDQEHSDTVIYYAPSTSQQRYSRTAALSATRLSPTDESDVLLWAGRPLSGATEVRLLAVDGLDASLAISDGPLVSSEDIEWLPGRLESGAANYAVLRELQSGSPRPRLLTSITITPPTDASFAVGGVPLTSAVFSALDLESRFDIDADGTLDLVIGSTVFQSSDGTIDDLSVSARLASMADSNAVSAIATADVPPISERLGFFRTLTTCDLMGDATFEYFENLEFYFESQRSVLATQTIRWASFTDTTLPIGRWDVDVPDGHISNARCSNDGEHLFTSTSNGSTLLIPPLRW